MVSIGTYLLSDDGSYVDVDEATTVRGGPAEGRNYVQGCLVIAVDGVELVGGEQPTDVDHLWAYLVPGIEALAERRSFEVWFPDAPVRLSFEVQERHPHRDLVRIQVGRHSPTSCVAPRRELIAELVRAGLEFHEHLGRLVPTRAGDASLAIERLVRLEAPGASSRVRYHGREVRVRDGECELIFDYLVANALRRDVDAGERLLAADDSVVAPWRATEGASLDLEGLIDSLGGARLRSLLKVDPAAVEEVAGAEPELQRRLARMLERVGALLDR